MSNKSRQLLLGVIIPILGLTYSVGHLATKSFNKKAPKSDTSQQDEHNNIIITKDVLETGKTYSISGVDTFTLANTFNEVNCNNDSNNTVITTTASFKDGETYSLSNSGTENTLVILSSKL